MKICVLMSTYNGEKYLKGQLDSILNQEGVELDILIRDDGSTDRTLEILEEYSKKYKNIEYYTGKNLKSAWSFMELLYSCKKHDYYAFADQDDVWKKEKLIKGIGELKGNFHLYGCKKIIVDSDLNTLPKEDKIPEKLTLGSVMTQCKISGCTMVFDNYLRDKLLEYKPKAISMHDSWVLKVAKCIGEIYYDKNEYIYYRQHNNNVVGVQKTFFIRGIRYLKNLKTNRQKNLLKEMAAEIYNGYGKYLEEEERINLYYLANMDIKYMNRIKLLKKDFLFKDNRIETLILKLLILLKII
jgi:glycosyltransferase involved in cell wall biosynthesis